jgi:hypothetical protein
MTGAMPSIGIRERGARAIDDVLFQLFVRCCQRCRASSFDFVVCHQVRWHGVRRVDFRLTLSLGSIVVFNRTLARLTTFFFWFVGSDFVEQLLTTLLFDLATQPIVFGLHLAVFALLQSLLFSLIGQNIIRPLVTRYVMQANCFCLQFGFSPIRCRRCRLVNLIRGARSAVGFGFRPRFDVRQLLVHEFCHCWRFFAFSA